MSYVTSIDVFCDGKDCPAWGDDFAMTEAGKRMMDKQAKLYGWTKVKGKHFCPACSQKINEIEDQSNG